MNKSFEYLNTITASIGMLLSYIGFIFIIIIGMKYGSYWNLIWSVIYGLTLILLHTSSTFYHGVVNTNIKKKFRLMDQSCIYLLIAGTYTPIVMINLYGAWGWSLFGVIWGLFLVGVFFELTNIIPFKNYQKLIAEGNIFPPPLYISGRSLNYLGAKVDNDILYILDGSRRLTAHILNRKNPKIILIEMKDLND